MSLILRQECQPILDKSNMQNYHVDIHDKSKRLNIVGECGKILIQIAGIKFVRLQPTMREIEYAVELLNAFIVAHKIAIDSYLFSLKTFKAKPVIENKTDVYYVQPFKFNQGGFFLTYKDASFKYTIEDITHTLPTMTLLTKKPDIPTLEQWTYDTLAFHDAKQYLIDFLAYIEEQAELAKKLTQLSICDI